MIFRLKYVLLCCCCLQIHSLFAFQLPPNGNISNPCPEGQFWDVNDNTCRLLCKPELSFDSQQFNTASSGQVYTLTQCTHTALNNLLNSIGPQGGIVQLPACTITVAGKIWLKENTIFQGAGMGNTVIQVNNGYSGHVFEMKYIKNSVLRDLTIDGNGQYVTPTISWYCDNIMLERVEVKNSTRTGISFKYSTKATVRYCASYGAGNWHGIESKDCGNANPMKDHDECWAERGYNPSGALWTSSFAVYSNECYNNGGHGINLHAINGEVAGNYCGNNGYGSKFFDAENVWVHHNKFEGNNSWGTAISVTVDVPERLPRNVVFYDNDFINNGSYPFRVNGDYAQEIYLLNNYYAGNSPNEIRNLAKPGVLKICPGSQEDQMIVAGNALGYASNSACNNPCSVDAGKCLTVRLKMSLEGALTDNSGNPTAMMRSDLYSNRKLLPGQTPPPNVTPTPAGQPYDIAPWNYQGNEGLTYSDTDYQAMENEFGAAPVDWVLVSFRRQAMNAGYIGRFAGVLLKDGTIVVPDGCLLPDSIDGSNYIVVEHRNHLPGITSSPVKFDGGYLSHDFTTDDGSINNVPTQKQLGNTWALYAGDLDKASDIQGFDVNGFDRILWQSDNGFFNKYIPTDTNLDGNIDGLDNLIWNRNNGVFSVIKK